MKKANETKRFLTGNQSFLFSEDSSHCEVRRIWRFGVTEILTFQFDFQTF